MKASKVQCHLETTQKDKRAEFVQLSPSSSASVQVQVCSDTRFAQYSKYIYVKDFLKAFFQINLLGLNPLKVDQNFRTMVNVGPTVRPVDRDVHTGRETCTQG